jgi:chromosome segregation ATPase
MHPEDNEEWDPITSVVGDLLSQTKNILGLIHEASRSSISSAAVNEQAGLQRVNQALDSKLKEMERGLADKDNALKTAETHLAQAVEGLHAMQTASEAAIKHALSSKQREIDALKDKLRNALDNLNTMKSWVVEQHRQLDEEKHALKSELDEEKRSAEARRQEQDDIINTLNERIKRKSEELAAVTKRMRSLRERIVQLNWKDQSSRLLAARKVQVQVNCSSLVKLSSIALIISLLRRMTIPAMSWMPLRRLLEKMQASYRATG